MLTVNTVTQNVNRADMLNVTFVEDDRTAIIKKEDPNASLIVPGAVLANAIIKPSFHNGFTNNWLNFPKTNAAKRPATSGNATFEYSKAPAPASAPIPSGSCSSKDVVAMLLAIAKVSHLNFAEDEAIKYYRDFLARL